VACILYNDAYTVLASNMLAPFCLTALEKASDESDDAKVINKKLPMFSMLVKPQGMLEKKGNNNMFLGSVQDSSKSTRKVSAHVIDFCYVVRGGYLDHR